MVALSNVQHRAASPLVDVYVSFEQTIETLRDKLQQSDFELCRVSCCCLVSPLQPLQCRALRMVSSAALVRKADY